MTAEINELFEEGITRSRELSDEADEALNAVDRMAQDAETLTQRVEAEGTEACRLLAELTGKLAQAEADLESSRSEVDGALSSLADSARALEAAMGDLRERVDASMGQLETRKDEIDQSLDVQMSATQDGFHQLVDRTGDAQTHAEERLDQVAQALAAFRTALDAARVEFAQKQDAWAAGADALEQAVQEQTGAWTDALAELLGRQASAMVGTANAMVDQHNESMEGLRRRFIEQAPQDLDATLEPVSDALTQMGADAIDHQQRLASGAAEQERWAGEAVAAVEAIGQALGAASRLG